MRAQKEEEEEGKKLLSVDNANNFFIPSYTLR
jgi:hypothetical protein